MSLLDKIAKNSKLKHSAPIMNSDVFGQKESVPTQIPMINTALSADIEGGIIPGLLTLAGPSKHFKTAFALVMASAFLKKYDDAILLFYDSEFGSPESYFTSFGLDMDRVFHSPITNIEELKFDITSQLQNIEKKDKVIIVIDSIGNLASKKEVEDALDGKSVADMTRAKQLKSLFRIVTPHLSLKDIPLIVVNHTYKTQEMYSKDVVSGGTGVMYSSDAVWIIGRQQEKVKTEITGYNFIINIEKSRHVREKTKIPISVTFEGGIQKWSGMFEIAQALGYIRMPKSGWYEAMDADTGELFFDSSKRKADLENNDEFWERLIEETAFKEKITQHYKVGGKPIIAEEEFE